MSLKIVRNASRKLKSTVMFVASFALALGSVSFAAPQFFGQVAHAAGPWAVNASTADDSQCVTTSQCKTIQAAINAATPGDTINVGAGTYAESINITKPLTIAGAGPDLTILDGNSATENYYMVSIAADNVTVENLAITNPLYTGTADASGIVTANAGINSSLHISHVKIHDIGTLNRTDSSSNGTYGINSGPVNGMVIDNSEIYNIGTGNSNSVAFGILLWGNSPSETANNVNIHDNNIHDIQNIGSTGGIDAGGDASGITINHNIVTGPFSAYGGIRTSGSMDGFATITNNIVTGASANGIQLNSLFAQTVTGNTVSGATVGIQVNASSTTAPTINFNSISGNTAGLNNLSANLVDATNNWWGNASGPGVVGTGAGDKVSTNVNYKPWCTDSGCTTFSSAKAITVVASGITSTGATLNGTNGSYDATGHSFWVSLVPFVTTSSTIPADVYSTPDLSAIAANADFSAPLTSVTGLPTVTPNTTYYFVAWSLVDGTWYPGEVKSFTTAPIPDITLPSVPTNGLPNNSYEITNDFYFTWGASTDNNPAPITYEYQSSLNPAQSDGVLTTGVWTSGILTSNTIHSTGAPDGTWYWQVRAVDAANNKSDWSVVWKMTIDTKAPTAPANLRLSDSAGHPIVNGGFTNSYSITSLWDNVVDASHYVYKVWDNIPGNTYNGEDHAYIVDNSSTSRGGDFNQGEGTYYVEVSSVDAAGNQSAWTAPFAVTYDKTAPVASIEGVDSITPIKGSVQLTGLVADKNPMNTYFVVTGPNGYVKTSFFGDGRTLHLYNWDTSTLTNGVYKVQFETRDRAQNKDAGSVAVVYVNVNNPQPVVNGENFNTHSDSDYKGMNVGFNIADFKTVSGVSVDLYDNDGKLLVTNTNNQKLLDLIASGTRQLSTPFVTDPGTYVEEYWNLGARKWAATDKPAKATVTVTGTNNSGALTIVHADLTPLTEPNDWTFVSILPVVAPAVVTPVAPTPAPTAAFIAPAPLPQNLAAFAATPAADDDTAVLGAATTKDAPAVAGAQTKKVAAIATNNDGNGFGAAWYWLLAIPAAIGAGWWATAAYRRRDI